MSSTHERAGAPPGGRANGTGGRWRTWRGDLVFAAVTLALFTLLVIQLFPALMHGELIGPDGYMRLVRVRRLAETGAWFDGTIPRSNAPWGDTLHWTRPLDVLILLGARVAEPFLGFQRALHWSGIAVAPLLLIAVCFATAWATRPLAGDRLRYLSMLAVLAQVGIMGYALPGRADHNMLILLAFAAMLGAAFRLVLEPGATGAGRVTGAWAGFAMWLTVESLAPMFVLLATLVILWVAKVEVARGARAAALAMVVVVALAVLLEHPPRALLMVEYDRVSVVHLLAVVLNLSFWSIAATSRATDLGPARRAALAAAATVVAAALMLAAFPSFFRNPMEHAHPELKPVWLDRLTEMQAYLVPHGLAGVGRVVAYLGNALLAVGVVAHGFRRDRRSPFFGVRVLLGVGLLVFIPLAIRWVRFAMYAELLGVIGTMVLLSRVLRRADTRPGGWRLSAVRVLATVGLIAGPLLAGSAVSAAGGEAGEGARVHAFTGVESCPVEPLLALLDDPAGLGDRPRTVLAHIDLGPVLLYRTADSVIATPYHRNFRAILDWSRIMTARDPDAALALIRTRGVDVVVRCGDVPGADARTDPRPSFDSLLREGMAPGWLVPVPVPGNGSDLRVYEVDDEADSTGAGPPSSASPIGPL